MAAVLTLADLYARVPADRLNGYFDDDNSGVLSEEVSTVQDVLMAAEGEYTSRMLRAYPTGGDLSVVGSPLRTLILNDATLRMHVAWIACELACERRTEFCGVDGWGAYRAQYERAIRYIENLSKGIQKSGAEQLAGANKIGSGYSSGLANGYEDPNFVFAPSKGSPSGHGGF